MVVFFFVGGIKYYNRVMHLTQDTQSLRKHQHFFQIFPLDNLRSLNTTF